MRIHKNMIGTIVAVALIILWAAAVTASLTLGGWIYLLPVASVVIFFTAVFREADRPDRISIF